MLAASIVDALRRAGVLVGICGASANVLKVRPPLPFGPAHAEVFLERFDDVLHTLWR